MPIDSLTAGPPAVASSRKASATSAGAPPGFSAALDTAAKTWTALAEGQTETLQGGNDRPAAKDSSATPSSSAHAPGRAKPADQPQAATTPEPAAKPAKVEQEGNADGDEAFLAADTVDAAVSAAAATPLPAVLAAAQAALAAATPTSTAGTLPAEASVVAQVATQVQAAAAAAAAGAPVDPAAPGVAELLASLDAGETNISDLPESVQALVAKATASLAPVVADGGPPTSPQPAGVSTATAAAPSVPTVAPTVDAPEAQTTGSPVAAAAAAAASSAAAAPTSDTDPSAPASAPLSPLAAAIQAAAQAQSGTSAGGEESPGQSQQAPQQAAAAPGATAPQASAAQAAAPEQVPVASVEPNAVAVAPASAPAVSTVAAPAVPTVAAANPSQQAAAIEALVHLSRTRGHSSARIALAPEQLGGIQVTLIFGADGVTARLIAERPEAAAALQRAGQDLKESLQQQGVDLARLETGFAGDHGQGRGDRQAGGTDTGRFGSAPGRHDRAGDDATQTLHIAIGDQPAPEPLIPGRLIDLRA